MQRTISIRLTWTRIAVASVLIIIVALFWVVRSSIAAVHDAYAVWNAGDAVAHHLERTGQWPRSWEDLRYDFVEVMKFGPDSHENVRDLVEINFDVDPSRLKAYPAWTDEMHPPFGVIRSKSGRNAFYVEPNWIVWAQLNGKYIPTTKPTDHLSSTTQPTTRGN